MMTPREVMGHVFAEPFRPFRIRMASGQTYEVRHPEMASVGRTYMTIFTPLSEELHGKDLWHKLSLLLLESIEPLEVTTGPGSNSSPGNASS